MANLDFTGDFPYAATEGNLVLSPDALYWDDITTLVESADRLKLERRDGEWWLRHECQQFDVDASGVTERNELFVNSAGRNLYGPGNEFWWGSSFIVPEETTDLASWMLLSQLHGTETGSPEWAIELTGEKVMHTIRGGNIAVGGATNWPRLDSYVVNASVPRGVRFDLMAYTYLATDGTGINKVWYRLHGDEWPDAPQVDVTGANCVSIAGTPLQLPAPRLSIYRDGRTETTVLYTRGSRVRRSREAIEQFFRRSARLPRVILARNPVGYWDLSEAAGTFADQGSGGHAGTLSGAATRAVATLTRDGEGAGLTLGAGHYVSLGALGAMPVGTIECLVNVGTNGGRALVSFGNSSAATQRRELEINFTQGGLSYIDNAGTSVTLAPSANGNRLVPTSRMHHLLMRWSEALGTMELHVNGEFQGSAAISPGTITLNNCTIGGRNASGSVSRTGGVITMQHVAIYDEYLDDAEIQKSWNAAVTQEPIGRIKNLFKVNGVLCTA